MTYDTVIEKLNCTIYPFVNETCLPVEALKSFIAEQDTKITHLELKLQDEYRDCIFIGSVPIHKKHLADYATFLSTYKAEIIRDVVNRLSKMTHCYYPSVDSYCTSQRVVLFADIKKLVGEVLK